MSDVTSKLVDLAVLGVATEDLASDTYSRLLQVESEIDSILGAGGVISDMASGVDAVQAAGKVPIKEVSIVKAYMMEMAQRVCDRAIQIHGAMGLSNEMGLEEAFRIARTWRVPDGTSEMQRRTIARQLLRGDAVF